MAYFAGCVIVIYIVSAQMILFGGIEMDTTGWISLAVAAIGVCGSVLLVLFQLKRDGKSIDRIDSCTSEMKPTVQNVEKIVEKTQDLVRDSIRPSLEAVQQQTEKITVIADGFREFKRLEGYFSNGLVRQDVLLSQIGAVFAENARLNERAQALEAENRALKNENQELKDKLRSLEKEDSRLQPPNIHHTEQDQWDFEE